MAYGDFKDLNRRTAADKVFCNKAFNIANYPNYDGYPREYKLFFDKKTASLVNKFTSGGTVKN